MKTWMQLTVERNQQSKRLIRRTSAMFLYVPILIVLLAHSGESSWVPRQALSRHTIPGRLLAVDGSSESSSPSLLGVRGGSTDEEEDAERYSRQVYTLGARAHGLIRSSTIYLDGPPSSGLLYECAKNLALSGVRHLVVVKSSADSQQDSTYHNAPLDDLGNAYQRAARSEIDELNPDDDAKDLSDEELLVEYLRRLNPNIQVSLVERSSLEVIKETDGAKRHVLLCVDRPASTQLTLNQMARAHDIAFVSVETAGVFGRTFCDFGPAFQVHDADGEMPLVTPLDRLEALPDGQIVVHTVMDEKHDVSRGDEIEFMLRNGDVSPQRCIVKEVQNPFRFVVTAKSIDDSEEVIDQMISTVNAKAASFRRVKIPQELEFKSLEEALTCAKVDPSLFAACDLEKSFDVVRRDLSMACFEAASSFVQENGRLPALSDLDQFWETTKAIWAASLDDDEGKRHCEAFLRGCAAKFSPFQAVFGAIAAQEALKAATSLYFPVRQFLVYDCDEVLDKLPDQSRQASDDEKWTTGQAPGLQYILGEETVKKLQKSRIFVVGAGAIGCEILKNLAAMGAGTRKKGKIILTDMDTIEKSNLSRQLLFRDDNIGEFKSKAAQAAVYRFNPAMRIEAHSSKVGGEGHNPFDEKFWAKKVQIVLNALDNVEARLYMDNQCVANQKALVDAGTMGPKGNVQVVVPFQSESYASSVDPPEPAIPVCTLKNFPYAIAHTIQWGRDLFDGLFDRRPSQVKDFIDALQSKSLEELIVRLAHEKGEDAAIDAALEIREDLQDVLLSDDEEKTKEASLSWAAGLAYDLFFKASKDLLQKHPLDSVDEDGEPFWTGTRRPPKALELATSSDPEQETINKNLLDFVRGAARLRWETLSGKDCVNVETAFSVDDAEKALRVKYSAESTDDSTGDPNGQVEDHIREILCHVSVDVPTTQMAALEFEKDVESNGHVAFVAAASNLRAICYGITPVDKMETRRVAGNIVPAMITTTAFVSALSCIELVKLTQKRELRVYRNAFINLALPFFAFTVPLPAEETQGIGEKCYTLWDRIVIREKKKAAASGGITMKSFLRKLKKLLSDDSERVDISTVSYGPFMLFANFLHEGDTELLDKSLHKLIEEAVEDSEKFEAEFSRDDESAHSIKAPLEINPIDLTVLAEDLATGNEIELPIVRVKRRKTDNRNEQLG